MAPTAPNSPSMQAPVSELNCGLRLSIKPCAAPPLKTFNAVIRLTPLQQESVANNRQVANPDLQRIENGIRDCRSYRPNSGFSGTDADIYCDDKISYSDMFGNLDFRDRCAVSVDVLVAGKPETITRGRLYFLVSSLCALQPSGSHPALAH